MYYPRTILNNYNAALPEENIFKHFPWIWYQYRRREIFIAILFLLQPPGAPGPGPPTTPLTECYCIFYFVVGPGLAGAWACPGNCDVTQLIPQPQVRTPATIILLLPPPPPPSSHCTLTCSVRKYNWETDLLFSPLSSAPRQTNYPNISPLEISRGNIRGLIQRSSRLWVLV